MTRASEALASYIAQHGGVPSMAHSTLIALVEAVEDHHPTPECCYRSGKGCSYVGQEDWCDSCRGCRAIRQALANLRTAMGVKG